MKLTTQALSEQRRLLRELLAAIEQLAYKSAHADPLIRGTPGEVFRSCGKKNCRCATDKTQRHGPYRVVQIFREGKSQQIALKKDDTESWERVQHYQQQMQYFSQLKEKMQEVEKVVDGLIQSRLVQGWPKK